MKKLLLAFLGLSVISCSRDDTSISETGKEGSPAPSPLAAPAVNSPAPASDAAGSAGQEGGSASSAGQAPQAGAPGQARSTGPTKEAVEASVARAQSGEGFNQKDYPPDFKLKVLANGKGEQSLHSLIGLTPSDPVEGVVIAFVASWCGRCKASYPTLEALQEEHGKALRVLLLTAEVDDEGRAKMVDAVKAAGLTLPLLEATPDLVDLWLGDKKNLPRYYLLDYKGMVRVKDTGFGNKMKGLLPNQVAWLLERHAQETTSGTAVR